ncbi:hypothetical protein RhiirA4_400376, partial [Rhizophagus irregularis]
MHPETRLSKFYASKDLVIWSSKSTCPINRLPKKKREELKYLNPTCSDRRVSHQNLEYKICLFFTFNCIITFIIILIFIKIPDRSAAEISRVQNRTKN